MKPLDNVALVVVVLLAGAIAVPPSAWAYCINVTCGLDACQGESSCTIGEVNCEADRNGSPLCTLCGPGTIPPQCNAKRWPGSCAGFAVQEDGSAKLGLSSEEASTVIQKAFETWANIECPGGGKPGLHLYNLGTVPCAEATYYRDKGAGNASIVTFRDDKWEHNPRSGNDGVLALTTLTVDPRNGDALDADIEVNTLSNAFSLDQEPNTFDVQGVLTHEAGHFLGIAHSEHPDAVMRPGALAPESFGLRKLTSDDILAVCSLYPPDPQVGPACDPLTRNGFSPYCLDDQIEGDCSVALRPPGTQRRLVPSGLCIGLALLWTRRLRAAQRARRTTTQ